MSNLNLSPCSYTISSTKNLSIPASSCDQQQDISLSNIQMKGKGPWFNASTLLRPLSEAKITPINVIHDLSTVQIPESFSWLKKGGDKIEDGSRNQKECGCCWAMSVVSVLGDRYALQHNMKAPYPSAANLISCGGPWVGSKSIVTDGVHNSANQQCKCEV